MGSVYQRGNSWVGQYKDRGKTVQKAFGKKSLITKTMAREILKKIEHQIKLGKYDMLDTEIPTLIAGLTPELNKSDSKNI